MALEQVSSIGYKTKAQVAYDSLREAILNGSLAPGRRLIGRTLAVGLGMSEIPVREAIQQLNREGLVALVPHAGARVSDLQVGGLAEILLIRSELEDLATRLAVGHLTHETFAHLERQMVEMDAIIASGNYESYGMMNRVFHRTIYDVIPYPQLRAIILHLWNQEPRARSVFVLNPTRVRASHGEHRAIIEALRAGDGERAGALVRAQKLQAMEALSHPTRPERPAP